MTTMNLENIRDELCHFLRASNVLSTSARGVTAKTETWTVGIAGEASHTLGFLPVRNFTAVTVNSVPLTYLRDYTANFSTGVITWVVPLVSTDAVSVSYVYGVGDKIYPDFPRDDISLRGSYPRIGIQITSVSTEPIGLGGMAHMSDILVTVMVIVPANKDSSTNGGMGGLADLEEIHRLVRNAVRTGAKSFYNFSWITVESQSPLMKGTNDILLMKSQDFRIKFLVE